MTTPFAVPNVGYSIEQNKLYTSPNVDASPPSWSRTGQVERPLRDFLVQSGSNNPGLYLLSDAGLHHSPTVQPTAFTLKQAIPGGRIMRQMAGGQLGIAADSQWAYDFDFSKGKQGFEIDTTYPFGAYDGSKWVSTNLFIASHNKTYRGVYITISFNDPTTLAPIVTTITRIYMEFDYITGPNIAGLSVEYGTTSPAYFNYIPIPRDSATNRIFEWTGSLNTQYLTFTPLPSWMPGNVSSLSGDAKIYRIVIEGTGIDPLTGELIPARLFYTPNGGVTMSSQPIGSTARVQGYDSDDFDAGVHLVGADGNLYFTSQSTGAFSQVASGLSIPATNTAVRAVRVPYLKIGSILKNNAPTALDFIYGVDTPISNKTLFKGTLNTALGSASETDITPLISGTRYKLVAGNGNQIITYGNNSSRMVGFFEPVSGSGVKLLGSDDGGVTWTIRNSGFNGSWVRFVEPAEGGDGRKLWVAGTDGVAFSSDGGYTLQSKTGNLPNSGVIGVQAGALVAQSKAKHRPSVGKHSARHATTAANDPCSGNPILLRDGNKILAFTDLVVQTPSEPLTFERFYDQQMQADASFNYMGLGWSHNQDYKLILTGTAPNRTADVLVPGGFIQLQEQGSGHFEALPGSADFMDYVSANSEYVLTAQDKTTFIFDATTFRLKSRTWTNGEVWTYTYTSSKLTLIDDGYNLGSGTGRQLKFSYISNPGQFDDGKLWRVGDHTAGSLDTGSPTGRFIEFSYVPQKLNGQTVSSPKALLSTVTDVRGKTWTYEYLGQITDEDILFSEFAPETFLVNRLSPAVDTDGDGTTNTPYLLEHLNYYHTAASLLANWDMELDQDWTNISGAAPTTNERSSTQQHQGDYSRHVVASAAGQGIESVALNLLANQYYKATAVIRVISGSVKMKVSGTTVADKVVNANSGFEPVSSFYIPASNQTVRLQFIAEGGAAEFYVDNALFQALDMERLQQIWQYRGSPSLNEAEAAIWTEYYFDPEVDAAGRFTSTETPSTGITTTHYFADDAGERGVYLGTDNALDEGAEQLLSTDYRPINQVDARGNETQLSWGNRGLNLEQVVDALGNELSIQYNTNDTRHAVNDPEGRRTVYTYGDGSNPRLPTLVKVFSDATETTVLHWQTFTYDSKGRVITAKVIDPADGTTVLSQVTRTYHSSGVGNGLLASETIVDVDNSANNQSTSYTYDTYGRVVMVQHSSLLGTCQKSYTIYDAAGNVVASICNYENAGAAPTNVAQAVALFSSSTPDINRVTTREYDELGRRIKTTSNAGATYAMTTLTVYDALDRVVRTIANYDPTGVTSPYTAARSAFSHGTDNTKNLITDTAYNALGAVRKQIDVLENVTLFGYDAAGRLVKTVQSASQPSYNNDAADVGADLDLSSYVPADDPDLDIISTQAYDANGNVIQTIDPLGRVTLTGYDALNRVVKVIQSASQPDYDVAADPELSAYEPVADPDQDMISTTEYNAIGQVIRTTDALGNVTLIGYDALGRQVKTIRNASVPAYNLSADPDLSAYTPGSAADEDLISLTTYDTDGRVLYSTDLSGEKTWIGYDGLGRQIKTIANAQGTATNGGTGDPRSDTYTVSSDADEDLITQTHYDVEGRVKWTKDVLGRYTLFGYDDLNRRVRVVRNATDEDYDTAADPDLSSYTPSGASDEDQITRTVYDSQGRVWKSFDSRGNETRYSYDALGRQLQTIVNYGNGVYDSNTPDEDLISSVTYDLGGRVIQQVDPAGIVTRYQYDRLGRRVRTIFNHVNGVFDIDVPDADLISQTVYNQGGQVIESIDPRGTKTAFSYDRAGRRVTTTLAADSALAVTSYTNYDKAGRVLRQIRNLTWEEGALLPDVRDEAGNWLFDPTDHGADNDRNLITTYTLDKLGRTVAVTDPEGNTVSTVYARDGRVLSTTDPMGAVTQYRYDKLRRRVRTVQGYLSNGVDPQNWVWSGTNTRWENGSGTALSHGTDNDRNIIVDVTYDKAGRRLSQRDPRGNMTTYQYDQMDRRTELENALSNAWTTVYTNLSGGGFKVSLTDPLTHVTERIFDRLGRLQAINYLSESPKLTPDVTFAYDAQGNRVQMRELDGSTLKRETLYSYDDLRRLVSVAEDTDGDGDIDQTVSYEYDVAGNRTKLTMPGSLSVTYAYNERGQVILMRDWDGWEVEYTYDDLGRIQTVKRSNGLATRYAYDGSSRLRDLRHYEEGGDTMQHFLYRVDERGNRTRQLEANRAGSPGTTVVSIGTTNDSLGVKSKTLIFYGIEITLTFNTGNNKGIVDIYLGAQLWGSLDTYAASTGQISVTIDCPLETEHTITLLRSADKNPASSVYLFDLASTAATTNYDIETVSYQYDMLGRLQQDYHIEDWNDPTSNVHKYEYDYDRSGNRTRKQRYTGVINSSGTVSFAAGTLSSFFYNAVNQLTSVNTVPYTYDANGNLWKINNVVEYTWDRANRLLEHGIYEYLYNGLGDRIRTTNNYYSGSPQVSNYILDQQPGLTRVIAEMLTAGGVTNTKRFVHGVTGIHSQEDHNGVWSWMLTDGLGSVRTLVDSDLDVVGGRFFGAYGETGTQTGAQKTLFGYTGEPTNDVELVYLRARHYDPVLANFLSQDTLETPNRYAYVAGNPINMVDPSGFSSCLFGRKFDGRCVGSEITDVVSSVQSSIEMMDLEYVTNYQNHADFEWAVSQAFLGGEQGQQSIINRAIYDANAFADFVSFFGFRDRDEVRQDVGGGISLFANVWNDQAIDSPLSQQIRQHPLEAFTAGISIPWSLMAGGQIATAIGGNAVGTGAVIGGATNLAGGFITGRYNTDSSSDLLKKLSIDTTVGEVFGGIFGGIGTIRKVLGSNAAGTAARIWLTGLANAIQGGTGSLLDYYWRGDESALKNWEQEFAADGFLGILSAGVFELPGLIRVSGKTPANHDISDAYHRASLLKLNPTLLKQFLSSFERNALLEIQNTMSYQAFGVIINTNIVEPVFERLYSARANLKPSKAQGSSNFSAIC